MIYQRSCIGNGAGFTSVIDEKFKSRSLSVFFITELRPETAALNNLAVSVLTNSNSRYRSYAAFSEKLSELYGAMLSSTTRKKSDSQILGVRASWLDNKYAIDGEDISGEMRELIKDCIFAPDAADGEFSEESFAISKKELLDRIDCELNDKHSYALMQASKLAFRGEPAATASYGNRETALAADPRSTFLAYQELLKTARIEIYYVSPEKDDSFADMFRECFAGMERAPIDLHFYCPSPLKPEPETISEEFDVNQCKMVMSFKTDTQDKYALKMASIIYGELPISKLFANVREKMSLCYYCSSNSSFVKGTLSVDIGVDRCNIEKAKNEILAQLEEIKNGNITDEETDGAIMALDNAVQQCGDTPSSYISWYFDCFCDNDFITPEEHFARFRSVTRERIIAAARSLKLDSIYIMLNKEVHD